MSTGFINTRKSNFELVRIVAMFFIVFYHMLMEPTHLLGIDNEHFRPLWIPLHVGVLLFVLISGYFRIDFKIKGIAKLLTPVALIAIPIDIIEKYAMGGGKSLVDILLFLDKTPYWFIRTYFILFLLAPILNHYLDSINITKRCLLLLSLGFIAVYFGLRSDDISIIGGKNIVNFFFLYAIGDTIKNCSAKLGKLGVVKPLLAWVLLNIMEMVSFGVFGVNAIWSYGFSYCSPLLIVNAILLFVAFMNMNIHSKYINYISSAMFMVYIIHCHPVILEKVIMPLIWQSYNETSNSLIYICCIIFISLAIILCGVMINSIIKPIVSRLSIMIDHLANEMLERIKLLYK